MAKHDIPRMTIAEIVDELRAAAAEFGDIEGIAEEELLDAQAAQVIEEMQDALLAIADGAEDPKAIARAALAVKAPLKAGGDSFGILRGLLKRS